MSTAPLPEYWLRGPVEGVPAMLQPAAHALLQAREEIVAMCNDIPPGSMWLKPSGMASAAFHLQHIKEVINRLFTYAQNNSLTPEQMAYLKSEGVVNEMITLTDLLNNLYDEVETAIETMRSFTPEQILEQRLVGRKQLPSTTLGLVFHAAEHTMRHTGQLLVTIAVLKSADTA